MHEAALNLAQLPRAPLATVRWMSQNGSTLHAEALATGSIARASFPVRCFTVLLVVRRVVRIGTNLVAYWDIGKLAIFAASIKTVFPGHEVVIVASTTSEKQNRAIVLIAIEVPTSLRIATISRFRLQKA